MGERPSLSCVNPNYTDSVGIEKGRESIGTLRWDKKFLGKKLLQIIHVPFRDLEISARVTASPEHVDWSPGYCLCGKAALVDSSTNISRTM